MKWVIKHEQHQLIYKSKEGGPDIRWDELYNHVAKMAQDGWEPWALEVNHAFNTAYDELTTFASVWYKRPE